MTRLAPLGILELVEELERRAGRKAASKGQGLARFLDLDLLLYGSQVIDLPRLKIPHPRMAERRFVLEPLAELLPDFAVPPGTATVSELLRGVRTQLVERLGSLR
ncbi:MAG: 2-amino-4-hydroxy-6-hydroxymethyldihydropteridine pyrophosphokinase [Thermoanaerobaculia bacterium]|nr:2-amino-4-hydroxy-6-hydroxymethyldihydropteridine pyrophosphokinase [Thermoanaerobaculia bacterium]